jgi:hypothetical protein
MSTSEPTDKEAGVNRYVDERRLREERDYLLARYDQHMSPAIYSVVKNLERDLAWTRHEIEQRT